MSDLYPKIMTRAGAEISVGGAAEEAERRAEGWGSPLDGVLEGTDDGAIVSEHSGLRPAETVPVDVSAERGVSHDDEPTFGPPGDQTHRKRASKKR
jgi:hypothetical protein